MKQTKFLSMFLILLISNSSFTMSYKSSSMFSEKEREYENEFENTQEASIFQHVKKQGKRKHKQTESIKEIPSKSLIEEPKSAVSVESTKKQEENDVFPNEPEVTQNDNKKEEFGDTTKNYGNENFEDDIKDFTRPSFYQSPEFPESSAFSSQNPYSQNDQEEFIKGKFNEDKAHFFGTFAKAAKCNDKPSKIFFRGYKFFSAQNIMRNNVYPYKTFIHVNREMNRVVISIGGPRNLSNSFYNKIYSERFEWIPNHRILLEREFSEIYHTHIRHFLIKKLVQLKFLGFQNPEYIFNGHSIGASLAIYAAFDLARSGVINWTNKKPVVYSYGALRISDVSFATQVNKYVDVWRITKQTDYLTRAPLCNYCEEQSRWNCNVDYFNQYKKYQNMFDKPYKPSYSVNKPSYIPTYNISSEDYSDKELSRNVFERNEKLMNNYSKFYTSPFNSSNQYYQQYQPKKEDLLSLYFNIEPSYTKSYGSSSGNVSYNNYSSNYNSYEDERPTKYISPEIVDPEKQKYKEDIELEGAQTNIYKKKKRMSSKINKTKKMTSKKRIFLPEFLEARNKSPLEVKRMLRKANRHSHFKKQNRIAKAQRQQQLVDMIKSNLSVDSSSSLSDLQEHSKNYIYFTPPIGRQVYYTHDGKVVLCKRTYFGASTCELQNLLPKYFYSTSSHDNYLGINFNDCEQ